MDFWSAIVLIVGISIIGGILSQYLKGKNGEDTSRENILSELGLDFDDGYMSENKLKPYLDRIDQLEERVKVLERIATDKGRNLADEIDRL